MVEIKFKNPSKDPEPGLRPTDSRGTSDHPRQPETEVTDTVNWTFYKGPVTVSQEQVDSETIEVVRARTPRPYFRNRFENNSIPPSSKDGPTNAMGRKNEQESNKIFNSTKSTAAAEPQRHPMPRPNAHSSEAFLSYRAGYKKMRSEARYTDARRGVDAVLVLTTDEYTTDPVKRTREPKPSHYWASVENSEQGSSSSVGERHDSVKWPEADSNPPKLKDQFSVKESMQDCRQPDKRRKPRLYQY